jgi:hypothetical protein
VTLPAGGTEETRAMMLQRGVIDDAAPKKNK